MALDSHCIRKGYAAWWVPQRGLPEAAVPAPAKSSVVWSSTNSWLEPHETHR